MGFMRQQAFFPTMKALGVVKRLYAQNYLKIIFTDVIKGFFIIRLWALNIILQVIKRFNQIKEMKYEKLSSNNAR